MQACLHQRHAQSEIHELEVYMPIDCAITAVGDTQRGCRGDPPRCTFSRISAGAEDIQNQDSSGALDALILDALVMHDA